MAAGVVKVTKQRLWRCGKCGRRIPARNAMHVCRPPVPVGAHLRGKSAPVRRLFRAVRAAVKKLGPVVTDSTKTRIAFAGEPIFLELTPQQSGWRGCLMLARRARHRSVERIISPTPGRHYHFFRLTEPRQIDARFRRLLAEAYRTVGRRERLKGGARRQRAASPYAPSPQAPAWGKAKAIPGGRRHRAQRSKGKTAAKRPLWQCPKCGRRFVTRNLWHSCARIPVDAHFRGKDPKLRRLFNALVAALRRNGPLFVNANKTRISFQGRMRFADVQVRKDALLAGLTLPRRVQDPRFFRVLSFGPRSHVYSFRLTEPRQVDAGLRRYLAEAYRIGQQEHLR